MAMRVDLDLQSDGTQRFLQDILRRWLDKNKKTA
jgi:hypothetical protein